MTFTMNNSTFKINMEGRVDSNNAAEFESELMEMLTHRDGGQQIVLDARELKYISSAGLRGLLKLKKKTGEDIRIINVSDDVYDIFDMTGFSEMFEVVKHMRKVTYSTANVISRSINGSIYKLDKDTMLKVYNGNVKLDDIRKEREYAHKALVNGIPTLIPYDVVDTAGGYGIVMEAADMVTLAQYIQKHPDDIEKYADRFASFLKELHQTSIEPGVFPDIKDRYRAWIKNAGNRVDSKDIEMITSLVERVPDKDTFVHGDINLANVLINGDELLLMDMVGSSTGNPLFDLQGLYASLIMMEKEKPMYCSTYFGVSSSKCEQFWNAFLKAYMKGSSSDPENLLKQLKIYYILKRKLFE